MSFCGLQLPRKSHAEAGNGHTLGLHDVESPLRAFVALSLEAIIVEYSGSTRLKCSFRKSVQVLHVKSKMFSYLVHDGHDSFRYFFNFPSWGCCGVNYGYWVKPLRVGSILNFRNLSCTAFLGIQGDQYCILPGVL